MKSAANTLPNDTDTLRGLVAEQLARNAHLTEHNEQLLSEINEVKTQAAWLQEQLNIVLAKRYAASSEKISPDQLRLFDEAETAASDTTPVEIDDLITVPEHSRKKPGRKPLPANLPRVDVVYTLDEADRVCPHDGAPLAEIGHVISEQLDIVPAKIQVIRHIRKQYACDCGHCIRTALLPAQPIPKSMASPGLLAHVVVSKYQDALPLYRQETILRRLGIELPRATMANWMIDVGQLVQPLINLLQDRLLAYDVMQMDETPVQVLKEPGKTAQSKSYLWVQRGGPPDSPVILFNYDPSRSQSVPVRLLAGFSGYLQTDGYEGYSAAVMAGGLVPVGCFAHARRKFDEAVKAQGKKPRPGKAQQGLAFIRKLYRVEQAVREATPEERHAYRQQHAQPILDELRTWLDAALPQVPPKSATGKALNYLHNQWSKLINYMKDGRLKIDNNGAENAIRPFVLGRKNWLFSASVKGIKASANLYSLIETAKANGEEPYAWLRRVFTELPKADTVEAIEALLPGKR